MSNPHPTGSLSTQPGSISNAADKDSGIDLDLKEMREDLSQLAGVVAQVADRRMKRARVKTEVAMREHPWTTVSLAAVAGCLLALVVTPRRRQQTSVFSRLPDFQFSDVGRYIPVSAIPQYNFKPITSRLEQVADSISRIDTEAASPAIEKIRDWFSSAMSRFRT